MRSILKYFFPNCWNNFIRSGFSNAKTPSDVEKPPLMLKNHCQVWFLHFQAVVFEAQEWYYHKNTSCIFKPVGESKVIFAAGCLWLVSLANQSQVFVLINQWEASIQQHKSRHQEDVETLAIAGCSLQQPNFRSASLLHFKRLK